MLKLSQNYPGNRDFSRARTRVASGSRSEPDHVRPTHKPTRSDTSPKTKAAHKKSLGYAL